MVDQNALIQLIGRIFEVVGASTLVIGAFIALVSFAVAIIRHRGATQAYRTLRRGLGQGILLGLEFLVAADIIRSVAVAPTLQSVIVLGIIVLIRTFLSWSLEVEITGKWPWQRAQSGRATEPTEEGREL